MKRTLIFVLIFTLCITMAVVFAGCGGQINKDDVDDAGEKIENAITKTLNKPTNVVYNGTALTWDAVKDADGYELTINDQKYPLNVNSYSLSEVDIMEDMSFSIKATDSTKKKKTSDATPYSIKILENVVGYKIDDGILSWAPVAGADGYIVSINGIESECSTPYYENIPAGRTVEIKVRAKRTGTETESYISKYDTSMQNVNIIATPTGVSFNKATLTMNWNTVDKANGYVVKVVLNGKEIERKTVASNINELQYPYSVAGKYEMSVKATGVGDGMDNNGSKFSEPLVITRLGVPANCKFMDGANNATDITFDAVKDATSYTIKINGIEHSTPKTTYRHVFEKSSDQINRTIEIYANGESERVLNSLESAKFVLTQLAIPVNIAMTDSVIKWDTVNNANGYIVTIDGEERKIDHNQVDLRGMNISAGTHTYSVRAKGNGANIVSSWSSEVHTFKKLPAPKNLTVSEKVLTWEPTVGATNYVIELGEVKVQNVQVNSYKIKDDEIKKNTNIKVIAKGNGKEILDSEYSESCLIYKLATPTDLKTDNANMMWNTVEHAGAYEIKFNSIVKVVDQGNSYSWNEFDAGSYKIVIKAIGDGSKYFDSVESDPIVIKKLASPVASESATNFTWTKSIDAAKYEIALQGELLNVDNTTREYTRVFEQVGQYNFKVRAVGNGVDKVTSSWSNEIIHEVKSIATIDINNFKLEKTDKGIKVSVINPITNATSYVASVGGVEHKLDPATRSADIILDHYGDITVKCKATGDGFNYADGNYSEVKTISILSTPTDIAWRDVGDNSFIISWNPVKKAFSYQVTITKYDINGQKIGESNTLTQTATELLIGVDGVNSVEVIITAKGNNDTIFDSNSATQTLVK